jgi:hypothetical protein
LSARAPQQSSMEAASLLASQLLGRRRRDLLEILLSQFVSLCPNVSPSVPFSYIVKGVLENISSSLPRST